MRGQAFSRPPPLALRGLLALALASISYLETGIQKRPKTLRMSPRAPAGHSRSSGLLPVSACQPRTAADGRPSQPHLHHWAGTAREPGSTQSAAPAGPSWPGHKAEQQHAEMENGQRRATLGQEEAFCPLIGVHGVGHPMAPPPHLCPGVEEGPDPPGGLHQRLHLCALGRAWGPSAGQTLPPHSPGQLRPRGPE